MKDSAFWVVLSFALLAACPLFAQSTASTAWVRHGPTVNGIVEGSLQQMTGESATLNGGAAITGDLLVPGTPTLKVNGSSSNFGGTVVGTGSTSPTGYTITLNGNSRLGHLRTRTDPTAFPKVAAPPAPAGARSVSLNNSGQSPGDFATLKNLTLNSNVGPIAVPAGVYGDFTANSGSSLTVGVAGATAAAIYAFQHLTLNGNSRLNVVGPVLITVANNATINGSLAGVAAHPEWLALQFSSGGLTLNSNVAFYGYVLAPTGTVTINSQSVLAGGLVADKLTVNGNGTLRVLAPVANQPPVVALTAPANGAQFVAPAAFTLEASARDPDGTVARVEFYQNSTKLGEATAAPYQSALTGLTAGNYTFKARAIDNNNAAIDSATISVTVGANQPPSISLTSPTADATFVAPATVALAATASDTDGTIAKVEFYQGATKLAEDLIAPYQFSVPALAVGSYTFTARAIDNGNAATDSSAVTINVVSPPNQPPTVVLTSPATGTSFFAPATINLTATASDPDGAIAQVEFFQGTTNLGATTVSPYTFSVSGVAAGSYLFKARATDNFGAATDSTAISVSVIGVNQPPTVTLTSPLSGTTYNAPATIPFAATATDADGSVAKVEFFQGTTKLGESLVAPFAFTWTGMLPGSYALSAQATDNQGATARSSASAVTVQATVPFTSNFDDAEGYVLGSLNGQGGWTVIGAADYSAADHFTGTRCVTIAATTPATQVTHAFPSTTGQSLVFIDFYAKLTAGPDTTTASRVQGDGATVALVQNGSQGELQVFNGNGSGGGVWQPTGYKVNLSASGQAIDWLRLTLREDYTAMKWDLYANGRMIAANLGFLDNTVTAFSNVVFAGSTTAPVLLDDFLAAFDHPLFADANKDGIDDAWESAHGISLTTNVRNADPDGDGQTNLQEYLSGTDPQDYFNGITPVIVSLVPIDGHLDNLGSIAVKLTAGGGHALGNAPVSFVSSTGGALLSTASSGSSLAAQLGVRTDTTGIATVYMKFGINASAVVNVSAGSLSNSAVATLTVFPPADADGNGLLDSWEIANFGRIGIDPAADSDGDGLTNLQEYERGTNPNSADSDNDGISDGTEVSLGMNPLLADANTLPAKLPGLRILLQADVGVTADASGKVSVWQDQSGRGNNAAQLSSSNQPVLVANALNGRPVVRFTQASSQRLSLPNVMSAATAGDAFVVVKASGYNDGKARGLWTFGASGSVYTHNEGTLYDDFGTNSLVPMGLPPTALNVFNLYNVTGTASKWVNRFNGAIYAQRYVNTVSFNSGPTIGLGLGLYFDGDIAEVLIYDRALTDQERDAIGNYLATKYALASIPAPAAPTDLAASAVSSTQVGLTWTPATTTSAGVTYAIERKSGDGAFAAVTDVTSASSFLDTGLTAGTSYTYQIKARTYAGRSGYSNQAMATTSASQADLPLNGVRLWLRADAGVPSVAGRVVAWYDQSGNGNDATQINTNNQPVLIANVVNGRPVMRFTQTGAQRFRLPNVMSGATAGDAFVIVKASGYNDGKARGLWTFGASGSVYTHNDGTLYDDFATNSLVPMGLPRTVLNAFNLYNVTGTSSQWMNRFNGTIYAQRNGNTVFFNSSPTLGVGLGLYFDGDIAEVLVYDRLLTDQERDTVGNYLATKYGFAVAPPGAPVNLTASIFNGAQVKLKWAPGPGPTIGTIYSIERSANGGAFSYIASVSAAFSYIDSDLLPNAAYSYRVTASNNVGSAGYSNTTNIVTPSSIPISVWADDTDKDGIRDLEETVLGSSASVPAMSDMAGSLKLRVYTPRP